MLILKAKEFSAPEYFGVREFEFSTGWLTGFKKRYHLRMHTISGERGDISAVQIKNERERLKAITNFNNFFLKSYFLCVFSKK